MLARMLGAAARHEPSTRPSGAAAPAYRKPRPGCRTRPAGAATATRDGVTIVDAEAAILREAKHRALAGETPRSIAADLNHRCVPSATGQKWSAEALRKMLTSGRISGRRERYGQVMDDQSWPAIITPEESDQLGLRLARRPWMPRPVSRRYLMSGIFTCGLCENGLYGHPFKPGQARYVCRKEPGHPGCGKVTIMADPAGERARNVVLTALGSEEFFAELMTAAAGKDTPAGDITRQLVAMDAQRDMLARDYAARLMTRSEWLTAREQLTAEADALTVALSRTQHAATLARFAALPGRPWQKWDGLATGARRALVKACAAGIPVYPATSRRWDPGRIGKPVWRV